MKANVPDRLAKSLILFPNRLMMSMVLVYHLHVRTCKLAGTQADEQESQEGTKQNPEQEFRVFIKAEFHGHPMQLIGLLIL